MLSDMGTTINRRRVYGSGEKLPQGAVRIEYLESTGTQWIDTGIVPYNGLLIKHKSVGRNVVVGSHNNYDSDYNDDYNYYNRCLSGFVYKSNNRYYIRFEKMSFMQDTLYYNDTNILHDFYFDTRGTTCIGKLDGETIVNTTTGVLKPYNSILIFRTNPYAEPSIGKIGYLQLINSSDELLIDLIPVRIGTTGYMYDKVSGQLFGNNGTGDFILGPDV